MNLELIVNNKKVGFIGDPHLGKKFHNVRLDRKGELEKYQIQVFRDMMNSQGFDYIIMVGDLFDTYNVSNDVLIDTFNVIWTAHLKNPKTTYIMMQGNHDVSRDEHKTSFQVLELLCTDMDNVEFITKATRIDELNTLIFPYDQFTPTSDIVLETLEEIKGANISKIDMAVGHWDIHPMSGVFNLVPTQILGAITDLIVSGHEHSGDDVQVGNLLIKKTGSMLPYSHAEDPTEERYITRTLTELNKELEENPQVYKDKIVRILLKEGEIIRDDFDCIQLTSKIQQENVEEKIEVELSDNFNFKNLFYECFEEQGLNKEIANIYFEKVREMEDVC